jgi:hypothetical protein
VEIRTIDEITDANSRADAVVGETLQVIDEILSSEILLRHRPVPVVLVADVAVKVDLRRHDGLACQIDVRGSCGNLQLASPAYASELAALDDECGVFDGCATVTSNETRTFEHGDAGLPSERRGARGKDQAREDQKKRRRPLPAMHDYLVRTPWME